MGLEVQDLVVRFGETVAVDGVDLRVDEGEIVALLGPSGSGKSTILRAISGLVPQHEGRIVLDGIDVTKAPPHRRPFNLMFQDYALFPHRDVAGNVAFAPRMQRLGRDAVRQRVDRTLDLVGLHGFGARSVPSLSGGEQQRVALARALASEPRLLMLDEPLGSLDRSLRDRLAVELRELFVRLGITAIAVTHDQSEAFTLADRVVVLRNGRVVQTGAPVEVWRHPRDGFVARFLGFANVFDVHVEGGAVATAWGPLETDHAEGPATLVIRPDGLRFEDGANGVQAEVGPSTFRGDHFRVMVVLGGREHEVTERTGRVPAPGTSVRVALEPSAAVVVDRAQVEA